MQNKLRYQLQLNNLKYIINHFNNKIKEFKEKKFLK